MYEKSIKSANQSKTSKSFEYNSLDETLGNNGLNWRLGIWF